MASSFDEVRIEVGKILSTELGHHGRTSLFSLENKNLLPAAPQNNTVGEPKRLILNTEDEYLAIRSNTNFSG
ncbi:hypothetical protein RHMOL_Rhmol01G0102500 [Rhododendron molle]|uniref:Uncharacterized protein n=1 Tax=Rhododendron molle TaxID=49168 RepID=A0ACC0Q0H6_RHOML|nr:hypothetical protein RHMOL_Rhmol01G0102500 [Rhododendron molle]